MSFTKQGLEKGQKAHTTVHDEVRRRFILQHRSPRLVNSKVDGWFNAIVGHSHDPNSPEAENYEIWIHKELDRVSQMTHGYEYRILMVHDRQSRTVEIVPAMWETENGELGLGFAGGNEKGRRDE